MVGLDDDFVGRTLPFPDQPGAGYRAVLGSAAADARLAPIKLLAQLPQALDGGGVTINEACDKIADLTGIRRSPTQVRLFLKQHCGMKRLKIGVLPA